MPNSASQHDLGACLPPDMSVCSMSRISCRLHFWKHSRRASSSRFVLDLPEHWPCIQSGHLAPYQQVALLLIKAFKPRSLLLLPQAQLDSMTAPLAHGCTAVIGFVNDICTAEVTHPLSNTKTNSACR